MKKTWLKITAIALVAVLVAPVSLLAQDDKDKIKEKDAKDKKELQQVIITRKGNDEKVVVEINGDKILVNGKPIEEFKNDDGDVNVRVNKLKNMDFLTRIPNANGTWNMNENGKGGFSYYNSNDANRPMLGVTTEKVDQGAKVNSVTKDGAAEKIGLKEGDIITKVGDTKVEDADDLSAAIKKNKPGDKVEITYLRDKKEQKATAELTKWKGELFKVQMDDMNFKTVYPQLKEYRAQGFARSTATPKLGLSVQDTDDGKGVKVIEVDEQSNAEKAGIKENDIISEIDGKAVNSTDEVVKLIRDSKEKISIMVKLQRAGKVQNIELKIPRKIKTADL